MPQRKPLSPFVLKPAKDRRYNVLEVFGNRLTPDDIKRCTIKARCSDPRGPDDNGMTSIKIESLTLEYSYIYYKKTNGGYLKYQNPKAKNKKSKMKNYIMVRIAGNENPCVLFHIKVERAIEKEFDIKYPHLKGRYRNRSLPSQYMSDGKMIDGACCIGSRLSAEGDMLITSTIIDLDTKAPLLNTSKGPYDEEAFNAMVEHLSNKTQGIKKLICGSLKPTSCPKKAPSPVTYSAYKKLGCTGRLWNITDFKVAEDETSMIKEKQITAVKLQFYSVSFKKNDVEAAVVNGEKIADGNLPTSRVYVSTVILEDRDELEEDLDDHLDGLDDSEDEDETTDINDEYEEPAFAKKAPKKNQAKPMVDSDSEETVSVDDADAIDDAADALDDF
jgi:hypothetical protein